MIPRNSTGPPVPAALPEAATPGGRNGDDATNWARAAASQMDPAAAKIIIPNGRIGNLMTSRITIDDAPSGSRDVKIQMEVPRAMGPSRWIVRAGTAKERPRANWSGGVAQASPIV